MSDRSVSPERKGALFSDEAIDRISRCTICADNDQFRPDSDELKNMRERNCRNTNRQCPSGNNIKVVYLGETPPAVNRHIYRLDVPIAKGGQSLARIILSDLESRNDLDPTWDANCEPGSLKEKSLFLEILRSKGIVILDCCQCFTGIDKPSRRRKYVRSCYDSHTEKTLLEIVSESRVEVRTCYANARRILEKRKRGFRGTGSKSGVDSWRRDG